MNWSAAWISSARRWRASAKITATSNRLEVFNGICGAESGNVPVATIAPALLVSEIEVQRKDSSRDRPPYLPPPSSIRASVREPRP